MSWLTIAQRHRPSGGHSDGWFIIKNENQFRREHHYFRNTARGMGGSENAVSMLQTGVYMNYYVPN